MTHEQTIVNQRKELEAEIEVQKKFADEAAHEIDLMLPKNRGDLYVEEIKHLRRIESLEELSKSYYKALCEPGIDLTSDVHEQIRTKLAHETLPFEKSNVYITRAEEFKQAQNAMERATKGDRFVNQEAAEKVVKEMQQLKGDYEKPEFNLDNLRQIFDGKSVLYLLTTGEDENNYLINLMLPIRHKENPKDFGELEKDLIDHVHCEWSKLKTRITGEPTRSNRNGLVQYTFSIPKKNNSISKIKEIESELARLIFTTQKNYAFGALGLRIDLERISTTSGLPLHETSIESFMQDYPEPQVKKITDTEKTQPLEIQRHTQSDKPVQIIDTLVSRIRNYNPNFPVGDLGKKDRKFGQIQLAILASLFESKSLNAEQIKTQLSQILPYNFGERKTMQSLYQALSRLQKTKIITVSPNSDKKWRRNYQIQENLQK